MLTLTREVRFAVPFQPVNEGGKYANSYAGMPPMGGPGMYYRLEVVLEGKLDKKSQYLLNIKTVDDAVRGLVVPWMTQEPGMGWEKLVPGILKRLDEGGLLAPARVVGVKLHVSPFQSLSVSAKEPEMIRLNVMFEFSAAHRLHNRELSDAENVATFGKCNNPLGHGHNYQVQVSVAPMGKPVADLERVVEEKLIKHYDHKHLNEEVDDFKVVIPSVENIATAAFKRLKPHLPELTAVTVWETPKTWAEYSE